VLRPGGTAIVTVPNIFRREIPQERRLSESALRHLFAGFDVRVIGFGGSGSAVAYFPASLANGAARRWPILRHALPLAALAINAIGSALDLALVPLARTRPASWLIVMHAPELPPSPKRDST
jgi:hypothetical protein